MRLAFCIFKYFPFGGLQRNFLDIAQALVHRGHDITVYTTHWDGAVPPGLNLKHVSVCRLTNHERVHQFANTVCALLRHEQFDAVVGFNKMPGLDVYYAGDPCYETLTQRRHDERLGPFTWVRWLNPRYHRYRSLERAVFNPQAKTQILMLSTTQEREYIGQYGTQQARCHQLPPSMLADRQPIADQARTRREFRQQWRIPEDEFVLLMTGSCLKTKGLDRAIHAFSSLPAATRSRCRLLTVGDNRARSFLPLAKKLGMHHRIQICGPQTDIPAFMVGSDVLIHPAYTDNTGTVLLESMAYALPSVVTEVCGYAHYIREANAGTVLPNPFAQASLNRALFDMLSSPHRIQWGKNGADFIKTLDLSSRAYHAAAIVEAVARERAYALATS
jgi:UDP-glucose:(heptosyl)LPS alpha-1,3-glucosyltransferase